jgi:hypothetical protein
LGKPKNSILRAQHVLKENGQQGELLNAKIVLLENIRLETQSHVQAMIRALGICITAFHLLSLQAKHHVPNVCIIQLFIQ